ncbi:MAG: hypothetical protein ACPLSY_03720 [Moorellaceae bacterium]
MGIIADIIHGRLTKEKAQKYRRQFDSRAYLYGEIKVRRTTKEKKKKLAAPRFDQALNIVRVVIVENLEHIEGIADKKPFYAKGKLVREGGTDYILLPTCLVKSAFERKGLSYSKGVNLLNQRGLLLTAGDGRYAVRRRINGTLEWCLAVKAEVMDIFRGMGEYEEQ